MLYDQAEKIMAALAEAYPQREVTMVLKPRPDNMAPRDYGIQAGLGGGVLNLGEIDTYRGIATDASDDPDMTGLKPVDVLITGNAAGLVAIFTS